MIVRYTICIAACAMLLPEVGTAQTSRTRQQPPSSSSRRAAPPGQARMGQQGTAAPRNVAMRRPAPPPTEPVSPELEKLLRDWETKSARVNRLSGRHQRRVYDLVFKVEKRADGVFYHERPDKGRIDVEPVEIPKGSKSARVDPLTKKPFELIGDMQEKWICDGKRIIQVDEAAKTATFMPIPPQGQGENIMNGPLPFLFGMKAEKAKRRYKLKLLSDKVNPKTRRREVVIQAFPRTAVDGQNWHEARIILDHETMLPLHVKLVDTAKTKETVFSFSNLQANKRGLMEVLWPGANPFKPSLRSYKINTISPGKGAKPSTPPIAKGEVLVPDVSTWPVEDAKARLKQAGLVVAAKWVRGGPAPNAKLVHRIRTVVPGPNEVVKKGATIKLVVFEQPAAAKGR